MLFRTTPSANASGVQSLFATLTTGAFCCAEGFGSLQITGELIEIKRYDFKNDKLYYEKIMEIKKSFTKLEKTLSNKKP